MREETKKIEHTNLELNNISAKIHYIEKRISKLEIENKKCLHYGESLGDRTALSRRDSTDICSDCGFRESMEDAEKIIQKYGRKSN